MKPRKLFGAIALGLLVLLGLAIRYVADVPPEDWGPLWILAYMLSLCIAFVTTFYDRKNFPEKTSEFSPKRGVLYFFLGWLIFPVMLGVDALIGGDFALSRMLLGSLALSILVGIIGTFTENVGV